MIASFTSLNDTLATILSVIGIVGFPLGLYQYWKAQQWKRAEFLAEQIKGLEKNELFRRAMKMLDFRQSVLELDKSRTIRFDNAVLTEAVIHDSLKPHVSDDESEIRLAFCDFFDGIERLASYVDAGLIKSAHLEPYLPYWYRRFTTTHAKPVEFIYSIWTFIDGYEYTGVRRLAAEFKFLPPAKELAYEKTGESTVEKLLRSLGPDHPDTVQVVGSLLKAYHKQGKPEAAKELQQRVSTARENARSAGV